MFKFLLIAVLGTAGLFSTASAAQACGGGSCCAAMAPAACAAMPAMPGMPGMTTPPAPPATAQAQANRQVYRSYSYEPSTMNRTYSRPSRGSGGNSFDAGRKIKGL